MTNREARDSRPVAGSPAVRALYVHIPFCHSICPFCAFAVHGNREQLHEPFVQALITEIAATPAKSDTSGIASIYIGGGTPSTLAAALLGRILDALARQFSIAKDVEVAIEVNPEDGKPAYFRELKEIGITRVSVGVQSFDAATLHALGRRHTVEQAREAVGAVDQAGFDNVNVDLMFGAPDVPPEAFRRDVRQLAEMHPTHISLYGLDIEEHTLFGRNPRIRTWAAAHREEQAAQYLFAAETLQNAGYSHYEVSNFCVPGWEGRQNLLVWGGAGYVGFGPGAHSWSGGGRRANVRHLKSYERQIGEEGSAISFQEQITQAQAANERLMLELRQKSGLDTEAWSQRFGVVWDEGRQQICSELAERGLAKWDGASLRLTAKGMLLADEITERLMVDEPSAT